MSSSVQVGVVVCLQSPGGASSSAPSPSGVSCPQGTSPTYVPAFLVASSPVSAPSLDGSGFLAAFSVSFTAMLIFFLAARFAGTLLDLVRKG